MDFVITNSNEMLYMLYMLYINISTRLGQRYAQHTCTTHMVHVHVYIDVLYRTCMSVSHAAHTHKYLSVGPNTCICSKYTNRVWCECWA